MIRYIKRQIKLFLHRRFNVFFLTGFKLTHIDSNLYPSCSLTGARNKEGFIFEWYNKDHIAWRTKYAKENGIQLGGYEGEQLRDDFLDNYKRG